MPPPSLLGYALLALLARRPATGYELSKRMRRPVGYFWTARHSQVYPELARLEAGGLVRHEVVDGAGPRPTKRYAATAAGVEALRTWLVTDMEPQPVRDLETLRLWSVWLLDAESALTLVAECRAVHAERLADYERELATLVDDPQAKDPRHPQFASRVTLEGGVRSRRVFVDWLDWMATELQRCSAAGAPGPP